MLRTGKRPVRDSFSLGGVKRDRIHPVMTRRGKDFRPSDISELGDLRGRAPVGAGINLPELIEVGANGPAVNPFFALPNTTDVNLKTIFMFRPVWADALAGNLVKEVQRALRPVAEPTDQQVWDDDEYIEFADKLAARSPFLVASAAAAINEIVTQDKTFAAVVTAVLDLDADNATIKGDSGVAVALVEGNDLGSADTDALTAIWAALAGRDAGRRLEEYLSYRLSRSQTATVRSMALDLGTLRNVAAGIRARLAMASVKIPDTVLTAMQSANPFNFALGSNDRGTGLVMLTLRHPTAEEKADAKKHDARLRAGRHHFHRAKVFTTALMYPDMYVIDIMTTENTAPTQSEAAAGITKAGLTQEDAAMLSKLTYSIYMQMGFTGVGATPVARAAGAASAVEATRLGLYIDSQEVNRVAEQNSRTYVTGVVDEASDDFMKAMYLQFDQPEVAVTYLAAVVMSFLKSGHTAGAAGLPETVQKLGNAVGATHLANIATVQLEGPLACYHAIHGYSVRLHLAHLHSMAAANELSSAFARRLYTPPPGAMAYFTADKVFNALQRARFWELVGLLPMYERWRSAFDAWAPSAKYEAPYATYFYDKRVPVDQVFRARVDEIMPYVAHIDIVMPSSTLGDSIALRRVGEAAANNDVAALFQVTGFASAMSSYISRLVRGNMQRGTVALQVDNG